mmetsp:Transcript_6421/g.6998  ORF Transcript_6421/g.6998 Transcript_6421/m.6998 type:complete len:109 (-) Transcript_6421:43-369(-)
MIPGWLSKVLYVNAGLDAIIFMIPGKVAVIDLFKARLIEKFKRGESLDDMSNHLVDVSLNVGGFGFLMHAMVRFSAGHVRATIHNPACLGRGMCPQQSQAALARVLAP